MSVFSFVFYERNYLDDSYFNSNPFKNFDLRIRAAKIVFFSLVLINGIVKNCLLIIKLMRKASR